MMEKGITSSAFGVGDDYDEDMLEAMARSGDGNFFHIDSPDQLPEIFEVELQGLVASLGKSVKLALLPLQGTVLSQVLNDLEQDEEGAIKLPNLTVGNTLKVVLRVRIPALTESSDVLNFKLSWQSIEDNVSQILEGNLRLEVVGAEQMSEFPANPEVQEQVALLMAARARQEAIDFGDRGDWQEAIRSLKSSSAMLENMESSAAIVDELTNLNELTSSYESGDYRGSRKRAMSEKYQMNRSRSSSYGKKRPE
jgi:Ca-activated chloride channel homolog